MKWLFIRDFSEKLDTSLIFIDLMQDYLKQMFYQRCFNQPQVKFFGFFSKENCKFLV